MKTYKPGDVFFYERAKRSLICRKTTGDCEKDCILCFMLSRGNCDDVCCTAIENNGASVYFEPAPKSKKNTTKKKELGNRNLKTVTAPAKTFLEINDFKIPVEQVKGQEPKQPMKTASVKFDNITFSEDGVFIDNPDKSDRIKVEGISDLLKYSIKTPLPEVKWRNINEKKEKFIVCLLDDGKLLPSESPKIHKSQESAEKEAERLSMLHGKEFIVMKATCHFKPNKPSKEYL